MEWGRRSGLKYRLLIQLPENSFIIGNLLAAYDREQRPYAKRDLGSKWGGRKEYTPAAERAHDWPGVARFPERR